MAWSLVQAHVPHGDYNFCLGKGSAARMPGRESEGQRHEPLPMAKLSLKVKSSVKVFNTQAVCIPSKHYMVDISERVKEISKMIEAGKFFAINRARQYGKTTTLNALDRALSSQYDVVSLDFQDVTDADFENENEFTKGLSQMLCDTRDSMEIPIPDKYYEQFQELMHHRRLHH